MSYTGVVIPTVHGGVDNFGSEAHALPMRFGLRPHHSLGGDRGGAIVGDGGRAVEHVSEIESFADASAEGCVVRTGEETVTGLAWRGIGHDRSLPAAPGRWGPSGRESLSISRNSNKARKRESEKAGQFSVRFRGSAGSWKERPASRDKAPPSGTS